MVLSDKTAWGYPPLTRKRNLLNCWMCGLRCVLVLVAVAEVYVTWAARAGRTKNLSFAPRTVESRNVEEGWCPPARSSVSATGLRVPCLKTTCSPANVGPVELCRLYASRACRRVPRSRTGGGLLLVFWNKTRFFFTFAYRMIKAYIFIYSF